MFDSVSHTTAPADEAGVVDVILAAYAANEPISVSGNGSKQGFLRPVQAARGLSTRELTGITLYSPSELILSARAGTKLCDITHALADKGQHMIAEPPDFSALLGIDPAQSPQTIGGVLATNLSGPRRIAWGAMRDHVMGVHAINGSGEVIRSGGRVLKNVTGLDICKLLTGSYGTLAVMTEITIKVLPAPERQATLVLPGLDPKRGVEALGAALGSPYAVSGAAYLPAAAAARVPAVAWSGGSVTLARIEDFAPSVIYRSDRLRGDLAEFGLGELLDDGASRSVWAAIRDAQALPAEPDHAIWRLSVRPSLGPGVVTALERAFAATWFLDWGGGLVWVAGPATADAHEAVREAAMLAGGTWMLLRAPDPMRAAVDVIPSEPAALARIGSRVKSAFDPKGILNPGRMRAGL